MSTDAPSANNDTIDPALVETITREVIRRLQQSARPATSGADQATVSINDRIVTASVIEKVLGSPSQLFVPPAAIVTPAATDEARRRGITIQHAGKHSQQEQIDGPRPIADSSDPARAGAVQTQLSRRGISVGRATILLSDTPARDVVQQCAAGEVAVMIASLTDVPRFADEVSPTLWVLDMQRMNIACAVNVIAQISQLERRSS